MIRYSLKCAEGHGFESWFQSADAFDTLDAAGMVACPECGSTSVDKAIMAPRVTTARKKTQTTQPADTGDRPLSAPATDKEKALAVLRAHVEKNSDYVGMNFAAEARKMHEGESPHRSIHGEAKLDEAKKLIEDGVPVAPLPFLPKSKAN